MFKNKPQKNISGFTLVESLIYIGVLAMAITGFVYFIISITNARNKSYVAEEVQTSMRSALEVVSRRIRNASGVNDASSTYVIDPGVLSLAMVASAKNPTIINLDANDGTMFLKEGTSTAVAITSNNVKVTNLVFTDLTGGGERRNIKVEMTMEYNNPSGDVNFNFSQSLETAVSLRR
jgi:type II secretory pathway pseudopilin PulG